MTPLSLLLFSLAPAVEAARGKSARDALKETPALHEMQAGRVAHKMKKWRDSYSQLRVIRSFLFD